MNNFLQNKDSVSICHKDSCIHAKGQNAEIIAAGVFAMLLLIGLSKLSNS